MLFEVCECAQPKSPSVDCAAATATAAPSNPKLARWTPLIIVVTLRIGLVTNSAFLDIRAGMCASNQVRIRHKPDLGEINS